MDLATLREMGEVFQQLEEKRFPDFSGNFSSSMARQIGVMSVYISERDAKKIIKNVREELEGLN
jgi:hypothetical protein